MNIIHISHGNKRIIYIIVTLMINIFKYYILIKILIVSLINYIITLIGVKIFKILHFNLKNLSLLLLLLY